ncbi:hypothetical protein FEM48_Zijuj10G0140700 [Ziziphus jujuba var. spinosa]|uniref:Uncharacterized protein n=1 Tax=Ziziphus jujuba var. spinosa TaxID=714518 RepID=A0A978UNT9_ZIZJJ|nr:hypothetical protein FEM48_Zijuj10G0140700 [Ziziphus jujuba var. spinosa]
MSEAIEMLEGILNSLQVPPKPFLSSPSRLSTDSSNPMTTSKGFKPASIVAFILSMISCIYRHVSYLSGMAVGFILVTVVIVSWSEKEPYQISFGIARGLEYSHRDYKHKNSAF